MKYNKLIGEAEYFGSKDVGILPKFYKIVQGKVYYKLGGVDTPWELSCITTGEDLSKMTNLNDQTGRGYPTLDYFLKQGYLLEVGDVCNDGGADEKVQSPDMMNDPVSYDVNIYVKKVINPAIDLTQMARDEYYANKDTPTKEINEMLYTQEMADNKIPPKVGMEVAIRYMFDSKTVVHRGKVLFASKLHTILDINNCECHYHIGDYQYEPVGITPVTIELGIADTGCTGITTEQEYNDTFDALVKLGCIIDEPKCYKEFLRYNILGVCQDMETYHYTEDSFDNNIPFQDVIDAANRLGDK